VNLDLALLTLDGWIFGGSGDTTLQVDIPEDGIMTGSNLYWVMYVYPWDATNAWTSHMGFYSSGNDGSNGVYANLAGKGLQILGMTAEAYAGRAWDMWAAYNTRGEDVTVSYGVKDRGDIEDEDNFNDGNYAGWTTHSNANISWSVTSSGTLHAAVVESGGYAYLTRDGLDISNLNITFEYDLDFENGAHSGGLVFRDVVLYVNPDMCGWDDGNPQYYTNVDYLTTGAWHHIELQVHDGDPYWESDLYIDGKVVFLQEPIEVTNWTSSTVGLLSPYYQGFVEWDDVRVADQQYTEVSEEVNGEKVPTNENDVTFWPFIPDYDPGLWEHEGSVLGAQYEWYVYMRGEGVHAYSNVDVYFAPRLVVEDTNFPASLTAGTTVQVPVEWENLPETPVMLCIRLEDPYVGTNYASATYAITNETGSAYFAVELPAGLPAHENYLWAAFMYPTNAADPMGERIGLDDTFRFDRQGVPVEPETVISVPPIQDGDFHVYNDQGIPGGCDIYTWKGGSASFDGSYTGETPPEGIKCFKTEGSSWAGWGVFKLSGSYDMSSYSNGVLRFWMKSTVNLKINIEDADGKKTDVYVGSSSGEWKEVSIPISSFAGVDISQVYGLFEVTADAATTFYVDDVRWTLGDFHVYRDAGMPLATTNLTWSGGVSLFDGEFSDSGAPEGTHCYLTTGETWAGWGVFSDRGLRDMSAYSNGYISLWAKGRTTLKVEIQAPSNSTHTVYIASSGGTWQEYQIPLNSFTGADLRNVYGLFSVTAETGTSFCIDDVRWRLGSSTGTTEQCEHFYNDSGIPVGSDVWVWWASQYWGHVTASTNDGGFEQSTANGSYPDAGYWNLSAVGSGGTGQCLSAAAHSGSAGLRQLTGNDGTAYETVSYQEYDAYAGDIFKAEVYARQPSGQGWVSGSSAYLELEFLDAWHQSLTSYVSSASVTSSGQGWTLCSLGDTTAPFGSRHVRVKLVVEKPNGYSGQSVAEFDDCVLKQGNSFNGEFTEDSSPPEGTKVFRSYCVYWSGWGVFYTNSTTNLSAYSNGYVKFWLKSYGYSKVEIQSLYNGQTNTAQGAFYGPTTNAAGDVVWDYKVIAVTNFVGVDLEHIRSPFMLTDPTYDRAFYVDDVKWSMTP